MPVRRDMAEKMFLSLTYSNAAVAAPTRITYILMMLVRSKQS